MNEEHKGKSMAQYATVNFAKGMGIRERLGIFGVAVDVEKEIVHVVVST